jgi:hypothetical protein
MRKRCGSLLLSILIGASSLHALGLPRASSLMDAAFAVEARWSVFSLPEGQGGEITKENWQQHPQIRAIRAIVQSVKNEMSRRSFTVRKRVFEYCEPYEDTERVLATDSRGLARFYQKAGGSDDSSLKWEHYYDEAGRLRFVFIKGGAVNGSELEHRIYFDEAGKRIWEEQTLKKGPGYTFPAVWPEDQLQIADAAGKFSSKSACPETKQRAGKQKRSGP